MATAPQAAMDMPPEAANPYANPDTAAIYDQMRQSVSPKEFSDEVLAGAAQVDPEEVAKFKAELEQLEVPMEVLDMLNNMVDEILANPDNYEQVKQKYEAMGVTEDLLPPQFDGEFFSALNMAVDQMIAEPAGVQAFAKGGIAELSPISKAVAAYGRNGDTMLAHITPAEARMLRRRGGAGTTNPDTGLKEYFSLKKLFKGIGNAIKSFASSTVGKIVTTVALGFFLGPAAASFMGVGSAAGVAAVSGFVGSAGSTLLAGGNLKDALKAGAIGGLTAGAVGGATQGFDTAYAGPTTVSGQVDKFTGMFKSPPFPEYAAQPPSGVQAPAIDATGQVKGLAPVETLDTTGPKTWSDQTWADQPAVERAAPKFIETPANANEQVFTPKKVSLVPDGQGGLQVPPGSEVRPFTDASGKATSMGTFPTNPPADATQFPGSFDKTGIAGPTDTSSFMDKAKTFYNENMSPSGIQQQGMPAAEQAGKAAQDALLARTPSATPAMLETAYQTAYKNAMPGIVSTYGPMAAAGIGALALGGGFKPTSAAPSTLRPELMKPVTQRIAEGGNQRNYYIQGLPGVKYDQYGAPIFGQNVPLPTFETGLGVTAMMNPKGYADGGSIAVGYADGGPVRLPLPSRTKRDADVFQTPGAPYDPSQQDTADAYNDILRSRMTADLASGRRRDPMYGVTDPLQLEQTANSPLRGYAPQFAGQELLKRSGEGEYAVPGFGDLGQFAGGSGGIGSLGGGMGGKPSFDEQGNAIMAFAGGGLTGVSDVAKRVVDANNFDSTAYLKANPDVAAAIAKGEIADAYSHYTKYGQAEGRTAFDKAETAAAAAKDAEEKAAAQAANRKAVADAKAAKKAAGFTNAYQNINAGLSYDAPAGIAATAIAARQAAFAPTMDKFTQSRAANAATLAKPYTPTVVDQPYNNTKGYTNVLNPVAPPINYDTTPELTAAQKAAADKAAADAAAAAAAKAAADKAAADKAAADKAAADKAAADRAALPITTMPVEPPVTTGYTGRAITDQEVMTWLKDHPQATDRQIAQEMDKFNVRPDQVARATGTQGVDPSSVQSVERRYGMAKAANEGNQFAVAQQNQADAINGQQIRDWFTQNPNQTDAQIAAAMDKHHVGFAELSSAFAGTPGAIGAQDVMARYQAATKPPPDANISFSNAARSLAAQQPPVETKLLNMGGIASLGSGGYPRRTGQISGPGTATSDSIPAMLSDGEFVMTAKAVRGAGKGDRRAGAKRMYALMNQLEKNAARG